MTETRTPYIAGSLPEVFLADQLTEAGIDFVREYKFHPTRKWPFDFAILRYKLAIEIEGGGWIRGRHHRPEGFEKDCIKYAEALLLGWRVFRFTPSQVYDGTALKYIKTFIDYNGDSI